MTDTPSGRIDWKFMLPLVLGSMMNPLNSTMLPTALVTICSHFSENPGSGSLLITPLYIAASIGQPLMGKLADLYDPKTINKWGFIIVLLGALIAIFAPSFSWLIVSRVLFGLGTSAAYPSAMALVAHKYGNSSRAIPGNVLGILTVASQVSMVLGPLLGGLLTQALGWQGVFVVNIPWVLAGLYFSKNILPVQRLQPALQVPVLKKIDALGILFFGIFLVLLLLALTRPGSIWLSVSAVLFSFFVFIAWEARHPHPFINIQLLRQKPSLLLVYVRTLGNNYTLYLLLYALPQWVEAVKNMSPAQTGLIMLPMSLLSAVSSIAISKLKNLFLLNVLGIISLVAACSCLFLLSHSAGTFWIACATGLAGIAIGINVIANQSSLSAEAPTGQTGVSFGLYRTFGYLGAIVSGTQLKGVFQGGITDNSIHACGWYAAAACVLLALLYFIRPEKKVV